MTYHQTSYIYIFNLVDQWNKHDGLWSQKELVHNASFASIEE